MLERVEAGASKGFGGGGGGFERVGSGRLAASSRIALETWLSC